MFCTEKPLSKPFKLNCATAIAFVAIFFLSACKTSQTTKIDTTKIAPVLDSTPADLIEKFNRQAEAVRSLNARVELNPVAGSAYSGVIQDYRDVRGFILAQKPASIRMIGQAPVIAKTIFDMVSDGETFRISIPSKNKFITGPARFERAAKKPIENLRPNHLTDALFWQALPAQVLFEEFEAETASPNAAGKRYYILTELRGGGSGAEVARKVWFDRADLSVARIQVFGEQGRIVTDARYEDWQPPEQIQGEAIAGLRYPRIIRVARPRDDYRLEIRITRITLNESIAAERFDLPQPPGSELVRIEDNM